MTTRIPSVPRRRKAALGIGSHVRRAAATKVSATLGVGLLVLTSAVVRFVAASGVAAPWISPDEPLYGLAGRSLLGEHTILSGQVPHASVLTPLLVGLPMVVVRDLGDAVLVAQLLQSVAMSCVAAVVFAWARPLAGDRWAFAAAALSLVVPGMAYSGLLMTEALFLPVSALALWRLVRLIEAPTAGRHALFAASIALAVLTRLQAVALVPAAVVCLCLSALLLGRRELVRAAVPYAALLVAGGVAIAALVTAGYPALGAYTASVSGGYRLGAVLHDVWWHTGGLVLVTAAIPLVALGSLAVQVARRRHRSTALVASVVVATVWLAVLAVQVGAFASQFVGHLAERDLLSAVPPALVALAAWCARGGGSRLTTAVVALAVAAPAALLPIARLATREAMLDSPSTVALRKLSEHTSVTTLQLVWPIGVAVAVAVPVLVPAPRRAVAALATAAVFCLLSGIAQQDVRRAAAADERWWFGGASPSWIDDVADGPVTWVHTGTRNPGGLWKSAFWNRRLDDAVRLPGTGRPGPITLPVASPRYDGALFTDEGQPVRNAYAVVPLGMVLEGSERAHVGPSGDLAGLVLWQTDGPLRLRLWIDGLEPNGDLRGTAVVRVWGCRGGSLEVTLLGKERTLVAFDVEGGIRTSVPMGPNEVKVATVPLPTTAGRCDVRISSPALVGTTRIERW